MLTTVEMDYPLTRALLAKGFIAYTKSEDPKPVVMVVHDWGGRSEFYCNIATKIAELGYVGFAIDMYGGATLGNTQEDKLRLLDPLKKDRQELLDRIKAAYDFIVKHDFVDATKSAAIGYCFGGRCVLDLARSGSDIKGVVSLHGLLEAPNIVHKKSMMSKVLILHGFEDTFVPDQMIRDFTTEMTDKKVDWQMHIYGNTKHSFTKPDADDAVLGLKYHALSDRRSWVTTTQFLKELFQS